MGKIRIKQLGDQEREQKQKERDQARREGKKLAKLKGKGGGRIVEMEGMPLEETVKPEVEKPLVISPSKITPGDKEKKTAKRERSSRYQKVRSLVDKTKTYPLAEALALVKKTNLARFDSTIEAHINTLEKGIRGNISLPHGMGKQLRIAIASDKLLSDIEAGKVNFEVLISHPSFMPKLAKLAKILGPKGLMPNPKNGTISENPEETAKKFSGTLQFKTEPEFPIIHTIIGKASFDDKNLAENFSSLISAIGPTKIKSVFLKSTMSPSVRVEI